MIGYIEGHILKILPKSVILATSSGVGYEIFPSGALLSQCVIDKSMHCFIYTLVREQEISLYGFGSLDERSFFEKLIGISGIGPKMALKILSQPINDFLAAIGRGDVDFITQTPGVGKKMAQKLILELKGKIDLSEDITSRTSSYAEAVEALKNLGYDEARIKLTLKEASETLSTEGLIKFFLTHQ